MNRKKIITRESKQLFRLCLVNGSLDDGRVRRVVVHLAGSKRRGHLALLSEFARLVRLERAEHTAAVESAALLPADLQATIQARLRDAYGPEIEIHFAQRPELIGGMRIQVGSDVYDGSVQGHLAELEKSF